METKYDKSNAFDDLGKCKTFLVKTIYLDTSRNIYSFIINYRRLWRWYFHELSPQLEDHEPQLLGRLLALIWMRMTWAAAIVM